jgi:hypothetical protein
MFVEKARSLKPKAPKRYFTRIGSDLSHKNQTRLIRFARDKHTSLSQKHVNYGRKIFYNIGL